ncbi:GntP family permease [Hazenella coriacea]|uniref:H+/gluconate symporter-like permease n=1 Tax=Hazenella coriacea TaxID=1179467 RepID=A0A4R3LES7_9BACL|nr:GntP family permease [Hazenella coriacea]TCS96854.1 H+/gluconate symporter-like permease [Hazenella coriacea]
MDVLAIFLALGLLILVAYRGYPVILFAPVFALLAAVLSGLPLLPTYTEVFMVKAVNYIKLYFPIFLLGAVFGKVMEYSGAAHSIAKGITRSIGKNQAMLAIVLTCGILTYGGVSLFVVAFAVYPFAAALFREADIPKRLIPATIALGAFTFTMDSLPGTPQIQNIIPTSYYQTTAFAAPVIGSIGGGLIVIAGLWWLNRRKNKLIHKGEGYGEHSLNEPEPMNEGALPPVWLSFVPLLLVLVGNAVFTYWVLPDWYPESLLEQYEGLNIKTVLGIWSLIIALVLGIVSAIFIRLVYHRKEDHEEKSTHKQTLSTVITSGVAGSLLAIMNTASEVGFGNVIATMPGFKTVADFLLTMKTSPLISEALSINILAGITGSASGGMSIALDTMGSKYLEWAMATGLNPELLHRIASMSAGGMDTLPHNGAVITLLAICGLTHRESYPDIFAITVIKTLVIPLVIVITLLTGWV